MTKEDIIEMANLLWKAKEYAIHVGIGNSGELIATIKHVLHKNFLYDMKKRTFVLKEDLQEKESRAQKEEPCTSQKQIE